MLKNFLLVALGSGCGGALRYGMSILLGSGVLPYATFAVNVLGCGIIGFLAGMGQGGGWLSASHKLLLATGFCGGLTTFSTFMLDNEQLLHGGLPWLSVLYTAASLLLGFAALRCGLWIGGCC